MDQIYQLQRQIQELRNEINTISQVAGQLQRSEANNAAQLQRLQHNESMATQQLNTIQQLCHHLNQDINAINNATQQVTSQMFNRPVSSAQFSAPTFSQPITGQYGITPNMNSLYSPTQFGTYSAQLSPYMSAGSRFGQNLMPDYSIAQQYTAKPVTSSMIPSYTSPMASASSMMPSYSSQQQFGTSGFSSDLSSSTYMPYMSSRQISSMPSSHLSSQIPLSTPPNMSFSSF